MPVTLRLRRSLSIGSPGWVAAFAAVTIAVHAAAAAETTSQQASIEQQVQALAPGLEDYIAANMKGFDVPGVVIGIVAGDKLVYAKGFGVRSKGGPPVDTQTIFQIGSTTKAFLSATMAIAVDRGKLHWDDRVVDLDPDFQMHDPWVTREFRVFDLLAQRSGLPPYVNDELGNVGLDRSARIRSLRYVEPVSSFRTTFAYINIPHILAGRIVARAEGASDWNAVLQRDILDPLGMKDTSYSAAAIAAAPNHAEGYRYTADGSVEVPFTQLVPYDYDGAGDINSNIEDMAKWVSLQLAGGTTPDGQRIVSAENLAYTDTPKVAISDKASYALGWLVQQTPNGTIVWHNGGTFGSGSMVVLQLDRKLGVVVLTNQENVGMPDAIGLWIIDRLLDNPMVDYGAKELDQAKAEYAASVQRFARPADPQPSPPLAPLGGTFANPGFGKAMLRADGDGATLELAGSGAKLRIDPWDGAVYTATVVPEGRFVDVAANLGPLPRAFAQFQYDKDGKPTTFRLTFATGQAYDFKREGMQAGEESAPAAPAAGSGDFAGLVDIGRDRRMYVECRGAGSPTVVLVSGLDTAADLWNWPPQPPPTVLPEVAKFTRVCAYDRPGAPHGEAGLPSRSDPVPQPHTTQDAVNDLHALLRAVNEPGPYVLVGHSYGGLIVRLYASTYPDQVSGMVLVDILSPELQDAMMPEQWETWKIVNARRKEDIAEYPDLERIYFDLAVEQVRAAAPIRPMPLVVLSADVLYGPSFPALIADGTLPPDTPPDFGHIIDSTNKVAQAKVAKLVPNAKHITDTNSGHNMMIDQPELVTGAIREVVDAVRNVSPLPRQ